MTTGLVKTYNVRLSQAQAEFIDAEALATGAKPSGHIAGIVAEHIRKARQRAKLAAQADAKVAEAEASTRPSAI